MRPIHIHHYTFLGFGLLLTFCFLFLAFGAYQTLLVTETIKTIFIPSPYQTTRTTTDQKIAISTPATLLTVGKIMLGRGVETQMKNNGADFPFIKIDPLLQSSTLVFGNLEGPITKKHIQTPRGSQVYSFDPLIAPLLAKYHVNIVSLANNHTLNQGQNNLDYTRRLLHKNKISTIGDPIQVNMTYITTTTIGGLPIVFIGFNDLFGSSNKTQMISLVQQIASTTNTFIFISINWGTRYRLTHTREQQLLAHKLIDAGADVIIGQYPHVVEDIGMYKGKYIFYSLGNFIFDKNFSKNTAQGLAVQFAITQHNIKYHLIPITITADQPSIMTDPDKTVFLQLLADRSETDLKQNIASSTLTQNINPFNL